jgi:WD40 repeat protein
MLSFGRSCSEQPRESCRANNLFFPLTYEGVVDIDSISDPLRLRSLQTQIAEFGQTPRQLFQRPHPIRSGPRLPRNPLALLHVHVREDDGVGSTPATAPSPHSALMSPLLLAASGPPASAIPEQELSTASAAPPAQVSAPSEDNCPPLRWVQADLHSHGVTMVPGTRTALDQLAHLRVSSTTPASPLVNIEHFPSGLFAHAHKDAVVGMCWVDEALVSVSSDRSCSTVHHVDGKWMWRHTSHQLVGSLPTCVCPLSDCGSVLLGDAEGRLSVIDPVTGDVVARDAKAHLGAVTCLVECAGRAVASASHDMTVRVRRIDKGRIRPASGDNPVMVFREHKHATSAVAFGPHGASAVSGDVAGCLVWYELNMSDSEWAGRPTVMNDSMKQAVDDEPAPGEVQTTGVTALAWVDPLRVVAAFATGSILLATSRGDFLARIASGEWIQSLAVMKGGRWAITGGSEGSLSVWDLARAEQLATGDSIVRVAASTTRVRSFTVFPRGSRAGGIRAEALEEEGRSVASPPRARERSTNNAVGGDDDDEGGLFDDEVLEILSAVDREEQLLSSAKKASLSARPGRPQWMLSGLDDDQHGVITCVGLSPGQDRVAVGTRIGTVSIWGLELK